MSSMPPSPPLPVYHKNHALKDNTTITISETPSHDHQAHSETDLEKPSQEKTRRRKRSLAKHNRCVRCFCCTCCLPVWARWVVWFFIISIVVCVIVIGSLLGSFTMPTLDLAGVTSSPDTTAGEASFNGSTFNINFGLIVHMHNPNVLPIHLSNINVTAYYRLSDDDQKRTHMGGGYIDNMVVPSNSDYNFTFPFTIDYNPLKTNDQVLLNSLLEKCGLTGNKPQDITVDYTVKVKARVLFVTVHPPISSTANFGCPLNEIITDEL